MSNYGQIFSTSDIKRQLAEANKTYEGLKTWELLYGSVSLAEKQGESALTYDYAKDVTEAYKSAMLNESNIMASNLGQGFKERELKENELALEEAFNAYQQNYLENMQTLSTSIDKQEASITKQLESQAEKTAQLLDKPYEYLKYMYDTYYNTTDLFKSKMWSRYLDKNGKLKSFEDIVNKGAFIEYTDKEGNIIKEWSGLFDDEGNITIKGVDFYDQMINQIASQKLSYEQDGVSKSYTSFYDWLKTKDKKLAEWYTSVNPYDYAPNILGQTLQSSSFRKFYGEESYDEDYAFIERWGGMTKTEVDDMLKDYELNFKNVTDFDTKKMNVKGMVDNMKKLTQDLGIEEDLGISWDVLTNSIEDNLELMVTNEEQALNNILITVGNTALGAAIGGVTGYTIGGIAGSAIAGPFGYGILAPVGAIISAIVGGIGGLIKGISDSVKDSNEKGKINQQAYDNIKKLYLDAAKKLSEYSYTKQREAQQKFNENK